MDANNGFRYAAEKLDAARRTLKRHPELDDDSIWSALHECWLGLREIRRDDLDALARSWLDGLDAIRGDDELPAPEAISKLDRTERLELYRHVVNLAEWFERA